MAAARAAYVAGFASTSNLAARQRYGVPTTGTSAHSFTLLHDTEEDAFRAQVELARASAPRCWSTPTTSPRRCGSPSRSPARGSARCASTPVTSACWPCRCASSSTRSARTTPGSSSPATSTRTRSTRSRPAPVDGYGVGTQLVTGSGHPTSGFVYKLVARENDEGVLQSVAKKSVDKISVGGRKYALRRRDPDGVAEAEVIGIGTPAENDGDDRDAARPAGPGRARSSAGSRSRPRATGTPRPAPSCRRPPSRCRGASPSSRPSSKETH